MKAAMSREAKRMKIAGVSALLLLMLASSFFLLTPSVKAGSITLRPNANGDVTELHPRPSSLQNWECVDETPSDEDGSYVLSRNAFSYIGTDLYNLPDSLQSSAMISSVTIYMRVRSDSDAISGYENQFRTEIKTHGNRFVGTKYSAPKHYTTYSTVYTTNPYTGQDWTEAEVDALQAGVRAYTRCKPPCWNPSDLLWGRCTQVWVEVQYLELTVLAEDNYGNSLTTGDVYIDGELIGFTGSTFDVDEGTHEVFVNDFWEAPGYRYCWYPYGNYGHWEDGSTDNPRTLLVVADTAITAYFKKKWCPGDVNGDGIVDILDATFLAGHFGSQWGDDEWDSRADLNADGAINILDAIILSGNFGNEY